MATFGNFANRLPDPAFNVAPDGSTTNAGASDFGPGFASVKFTSEQPTSITRTNSGRVITRSIVGHHWKIEIKYNPMTRAEFEPIATFLEEKRGRLKPFFIVLPQYASPQTASSGTISTSGTIASGDSNFLAQGSSTSGLNLERGDMITFNDSSNSNHLKAYKIVRVHTSANKLSSDSSLDQTNERRYYVVPPIEKDVSSGASLVYTNPLIRVINTSDVFEYNLGTNNLFQFSLNLEEAQP